MIGLTKFEFHKLLQQRSILLLLLFLFLAGQYFFARSADLVRARTEAGQEGYRQEALEAVQGMETEDAITCLQEWQQKAREESSDFWMAEDYLAREGLISTLTYVGQYPGYIQSVLSQADQMEKVAVFQKKGSFAIRNIRKTKADFARLTGIVPQVDPPKWIGYATADSTLPYILLLQVLVLAAAVFGYGQENGMDRLIALQYRGQKPHARAGLVTLSLGVCILTVANYGGLLLQAFLANPAGDVLAPLQSLSVFQRSVWRVSCLGYLALFLLHMCLVLCAVALFAGLFVHLWRTGAGMALSLGLFAASAAVYRYVPDNGGFLWLKEITPAAWLDVYTWMSGYRNIGLFGRAVGFRVTFYVGTVLCILAGTALHLLLAGRLPAAGGNRLLMLLRRIFAAISRRTASHTSVVCHQLYELLLYRRRCLLAAAAAALVWLSAAEDNAHFVPLQEATYHSYFTTIAGVYTPETEQFLTEEQERMEGGYSASEMEQRREGFAEVTKQWALVQRVAGEGGNAGFFNAYAAEAFFAGERGQARRMQALFIALLLLIVPFSATEREGERLLMSTRHGRGKRLGMRAALNLSAALMLSLLLWLRWLLPLLAEWQGQDLGLAIGCLPLFAAWQASLPLMVPLILSVLSGMIGAACAALLLTALSFTRLSRQGYLLWALALMAGPLLLYTLGVPVGMVSLLGCFLPAMWLTTGALAWVFYLLVWLSLCGGLYAWCLRAACRPGRGVKWKKKTA